MGIRISGFTDEQIETIIKKLGGEEGALKFLRQPTRFPIWKTVRLGTSKDENSLITKLKQNNRFMIGDSVPDIIMKYEFMMMEKKTRINLANVSVCELGFIKRPPLRKVYARGIRFGLALCPAEVGPQLRSQYLNQPKGEYLKLAMEAVDGSIFVIKHNDQGRLLDTIRVPLDLECDLVDRFLFRRF